MLRILLCPYESYFFDAQKPDKNEMIGQKQAAKHNSFDFIILHP